MLRSLVHLTTANIHANDACSSVWHPVSRPAPWKSRPRPGHASAPEIKPTGSAAKYMGAIVIAKYIPSSHGQGRAVQPSDLRWSIGPCPQWLPSSKIRKAWETRWCPRYSWSLGLCYDPLTREALMLRPGVSKGKDQDENHSTQVGLPDGERKDGDPGDEGSPKPGFHLMHLAYSPKLSSWKSEVGTASGTTWHSISFGAMMP